MKQIIDLIKLTRKSALNGLADFSLDQLNKIPTGFNNNIVWNLAHLVAVQEDLCYTKSGLPMNISNEFYEKYKRDSKPEGYVNAEELEEIKKLLTVTLDQLVIAYENKIFKNYTPFTSRTGVQINSVDEAIKFIPYHEGLHGGVIMALKRLVKQSK
jgi:hypothetical protein